MHVDDMITLDQIRKLASVREGKVGRRKRVRGVQGVDELGWDCRGSCPCRCRCRRCGESGESGESRGEFGMGKTVEEEESGVVVCIVSRASARYGADGQVRFAIRESVSIDTTRLESV
jgi:hypothetical protein